MIRIVRRARCSCWLGLLATLAAGCAQTATLVHLRPAEAKVVGIRGLAVLDVRAVRDMSQLATAAMLEGLQEGSFTVIAQSDLQQAAPEPLQFSDGGPNIPAALEASRRVGADALLVTELRFREKDGSDYGSKTVRFGEPNVAAAVTYRIYDVRSGRVAGRNTVMSSYHQGELSMSESGHDSETKVLSILAREGISAAANHLAPHETSVEAQLAVSGFGGNSWRILRGNSKAHAGDWVAATEAWQKVLEHDPENHAALFNLGVASEAAGDFARAQRFYESAANLNTRSELYREALERAHKASQNYLIAMQQKTRIDGLASERSDSPTTSEEASPQQAAAAVASWPPPERLPPIAAASTQPLGSLP
jgi:tetratricopeptide (TPR) repeat protein